MLALHPIDLAIGVGSFIVGRLLSQKGRVKNIGLLLQISLFLVKLAKHYFDTHPEATKELNSKTRKELDSLHLKTNAQIFKKPKQGALG